MNNPSREATLPVFAMSSKPSANITVQQWSPSSSTTAEDSVITEAPIALTYNGISHVVMMATPKDLHQFALGFSLSEKIINKPEELYGIEVTEKEDGIEVAMEISTEKFESLKERRRNLTGRTGCGLCGAESLEQARLQITEVGTSFQISHEAIQKAAASLQEQQPLQSLTGACHSAAWCDPNGAISEIYEDVGRHNALDKLIGALNHSQSWSKDAPGFLLISSRASFEMLQKSAVAGIGIVAAVSAPTSMAVEIAKEANITLVGFTRPGRHVVYANEARLIAAEEQNSQ